MEAVFSGLPNVVTIHGSMAELARLLGARVGSFRWMAGRLEHFALRRTVGVFCNSVYTERLVKPLARVGPGACRMPSDARCSTARFREA